MSDKNYSLINFNSSPEVTNNLIEKISAAIGWIALHETPKRIALSTFIDDIKQSNYDPLIKAAMISNANRIIKEYTNQRDIVALASQNISNAEGIKKLENDWLAQFMDSVKDVSNDEFKKVWALILAAEGNAPGSVPKSLFYILQKMDKMDAQTFTKFSSMVIRIWGEATPFIWNEFYASNPKERGIYCESGVSFEEINQLETLGLIKIRNDVFGSGFIVSDDGLNEPREIRYFGHYLAIPDTVKNIRVGSVLFTKDGKALYEAINAVEMSGFWDGFVVSRIQSDEGWK